MVFSFSQARAVAHLHARTSSRVLRAAATTATRAFFYRCVIVAAAAVAACYSSTERLEVLPGMIDKTVVVRGGGG
jgi:hypothetical protein